MSSPLQIAVLVLLGAALWGIFYQVNVLARESEKSMGERGRRPPSRTKKRPTDT